jgi:putative photosynthetic complex assembly protein 2
MSDYLLPFGFALFVWWSSTGIILFLNHLPGSSYRWSMLGATVVLVACLYGLTHTGEYATEAGAMVAFVQAVLIWAWLEMSYFMGFLTGPRKAACPLECPAWQRFRLAVATSLHHELAIVAVGTLLLALTWESANRVAAWTFLVLWLMRWSAKLNLFLGVPNINDEWIPDHLRHIASYIRRRPMNLLFPVSVSLATAVVSVAVYLAANTAEGFEQTGYLLVASLLALAVLEHWFLVLPVHDSALWAWALRAARRAPAGQEHNSLLEKRSATGDPEKKFHSAPISGRTIDPAPSQFVRQIAIHKP